MKMNSLSDDEIISLAIDLGKEFRARFGKTLGITGEIGEYRAAQILDLKRVEGNINKGFDAYDSDSNRVQIKIRIYSEKLRELVSLKTLILITLCSYYWMRTTM